MRWPLADPFIFLSVEDVAVCLWRCSFPANPGQNFVAKDEDSGCGLDLLPSGAVLPKSMLVKGPCTAPQAGCLMLQLHHSIFNVIPEDSSNDI